MWRGSGGKKVDALRNTCHVLALRIHVESRVEAALPGYVAGSKNKLQEEIPLKVEG
jgi:hypothetical protein